jgi:CBS domain-containing protein
MERRRIAMDDWMEDDLSMQSEEEQKSRRRRVLDQRMIREPIRTLNPSEPITVPKTASIADAVQLMKDHRIGCVLAVENDKLVGIFTERDVLLKVIGTGLDLATPVESLMTGDPEVLRLQDGIVFALNKMSVGGFRHVPLVDADMRPVGVVSMRMIVDYLVEFFPREVLTLPPEPGKNVTREREGA